MSTEATIAVQTVFDLAEFLASVVDLGLSWHEASKLKTSDGQEHSVEAVFQDSLGREAGLERLEQGYKVIADCHGLSAQEQKAQTESIQQVVQRYAHRKVLKELQAQGYVVAEEEKRADNSIRLVVRKWT